MGYLLLGLALGVIVPWLWRTWRRRRADARLIREHFAPGAGLDYVPPSQRVPDPPTAWPLVTFLGILVLVALCAAWLSK